MSLREAAPGFVCLYFGEPDECPLCGGSASLGGTQHPVEDEHGRKFCGDDCREEFAEFDAKARSRLDDWCPECGFDQHEHADECVSR